MGREKAVPSGKTGLGTPPYCESNPFRLKTIFTYCFASRHAAHAVAFDPLHAVEVVANSSLTKVQSASMSRRIGRLPSSPAPYSDRWR